LLEKGTVEAILFWDPILGQPKEAILQRLQEPSDLWHAGLCLGLVGQLALADFVQPTWMFNCDPSPDVEATSWRVSMRACLVRTEVIRKIGFLRSEFSTLDAAALEWGHRLLACGVLMRHVPGLLTSEQQKAESRKQKPDGGTAAVKDGGQKFQLSTKLPFGDELRFAYYRYGRKWAGWALFRALMTRYASLPTALRAWREVMSTPRPPEPPPFRASIASSQSSVVRPPSTDQPTVHRPRSSDPELPPSAFSLQPSARVTVLIPTVDRYPYLRTLLDQLRRQTVPPFEVIVVDQTSPDRRDPVLATEFGDLPLHWIWRDNAGQCSSRNAGLEASSGDFLLLLDDDVEIPPDLIAAHLNNLRRFGADSSSGVAEEVGAGPLKPEDRHLRASDVFPAGNTMVTRAALEKTGLFDLAYDKGARADGDLGMRLYLSGAVMILNGEIQVLHHHAPSGGLRQHGARKTTFASSRSRLWHRNLPSRTEMYLAQRYFCGTQVRETIWLRALGTFSLRGNALRKTLKYLVSALALPHTIYVMQKNRETAKAMLSGFPKIHRFPSDSGHLNPAVSQLRCTSCM
jgi:glycosyltransferase involved in cell wall biosynthesis